MQNRGRQRRQAQAVVRGSVLDTKFPANRKRKAKPVGWQAFSILFAFLILVALLVCLIVWRQPADNPNSPGPAPTRTKPDMASSSVYDRGLVTKNVTYHSVLAFVYRSMEGPGTMSGTVIFGPQCLPMSHPGLFFDKSINPYNPIQELYFMLVPPFDMNSLGYDMAKKFRAKFTHVSPVWYQLRRGREGLELLGKHDADKKWINEVRQQGHPLIVPRVVLEGFPLDMLLQSEERQQAIDLIASECKNMEYDGIVLEAWTALAMYHILDKSDLRQKALEFVQELGLRLHSMKASSKDRNLQLHLVIPPPSDNKRDIRSFSAADMTVLESSIDGLSLMTYDYSSPNQPGPNAPTPWISYCLQHLPTSKEDEKKTLAKVLLGLNFYGNDYKLPQGGGPITGQQYISLLDIFKPKIVWDDECGEHQFLYGDGKEKHVVFYPTLKSIAARIDEAKHYGTGLSIWEIGQGLEYFFDLL